MTKELNVLVNSGVLFYEYLGCFPETLSLSAPAGGGMSLSPVAGTEVPETANGDLTPVLAENGPQVPASVKHGGSRVSPSGDHPEDTGNYVDVESRVYDGDGFLEMNNHERTSALPSLASNMTGDSETCSRNIPEESEAAEPPGAAPLMDLAVSHQPGGQASSDRQQAATEKLYGSPSSPEEEEDDDGEKEKQDEEEDEKNDNKWMQPYAGGRTKAEVGKLELYPVLLGYVYHSTGHDENIQKM